VEDAEALEILAAAGGGEARGVAGIL
jgi:hypothetical protein